MFRAHCPGRQTQLWVLSPVCESQAQNSTQEIKLVRALSLLLQTKTPGDWGIPHHINNFSFVLEVCNKQKTQTNKQTRWRIKWVLWLKRTDYFFIWNKIATRYWYPIWSLCWKAFFSATPTFFSKEKIHPELPITTSKWILMLQSRRGHAFNWVINNHISATALHSYWEQLKGSDDKAVIPHRQEQFSILLH